MTDETNEPPKVMAQKQIVDWANEEIDKLADLGFSRDVVPPDIEAWQVRLLCAQRLLAEENYKGLAETIAGDLKDLGFTKKEIELFEQATNIKPSLTLNNIFATLLSDINRAQKNCSAEKKWEKETSSKE